ncbi:hypothetical protein QVD17_09387 [Tagetes erecta]|uniref:Sm domain-containing protein n=1 Tax=Tagetes erecta TaxID=13708 RepID=A0AAD8L786_TARER|nr:hypothetical protein QVD17_09387 [Tagetes erecta]
MGACFSTKPNTTTATTAISPATQISDHKSDHQTTTNDPQALKKEIFVIKHRVSHETDKNPNSTTATSTGTGAGAGAIQCDTLTRSNSAGAQNPIRRRRYSRSKRSFDLGFTSNANDNICNDDDDFGVNDEDEVRVRVRVSSSTRCNSKERRISISPNRQCSNKDRRISISPTRRSESSFPNSNSGCSTVSASRPAKMVSVPATDKSNNNAGGVQVKRNVSPVKRIHVKRNVSPARRVTNRHVVDDNCNIREVDHRRKSLVEIDNNAGRSVQARDCKRMRRLSRDMDMNPEAGFEPGPSSYASLLLEDIQNFHKKNASASTTPPSFDLPECVNKACLIMEAVADLNSNTSSLCSDDRWRGKQMLTRKLKSAEVERRSFFRNKKIQDFVLKINQSGGPGLESVVDQYISVITNDGRNIVGVLKGFDQATNIILDESHERVYSTKEGVQQLVLGLYIIRGDNISVIGELDEELDAGLNLSELRAHPLKPVIH